MPIILGRYPIESRPRECGIFAVQLLTGVQATTLRNLALSMKSEAKVMTKSGRHSVHIESFCAEFLARLGILIKVIECRFEGTIHCLANMPFAILEGATKKYPTHYVASSSKLYADNFSPKFETASQYKLCREFKIRRIYVLGQA